MERPILFSASMVRAILDGRKTQTRRVIRHPEYHGCLTGDCPHWNIKDCDKSLQIKSPYGQPGDRLWVRESFWPRPDRTPRMMREGADTWPTVLYDADVPGNEREWFNNQGWKKKPSIHMPRSLSRITLEITDVQAQRLHEITEAEARAEGVEPRNGGVDEHGNIKTYRAGFVYTWNAINAKRNFD